MSCPDWRRLAALRDRGPDPAGWREALDHADGCPACRRQAVAADPALLFRRLPVVELTPAAERSEVEAVRQAVAAMRTARRLSRRAGPEWRRWAAAAVLATAALAMRGPVPEAVQTLGRPVGLSTGTAVPGLAMPGLAMPGLAMPATIEGLPRPGARVYHMFDESVAVLMIVDESLDV